MSLAEKDGNTKFEKLKDIISDENQQLRHQIANKDHE
jgi:hypothetical protein